MINRPYHQVLRTLINSARFAIEAAKEFKLQYSAHMGEVTVQDRPDLYDPLLPGGGLAEPFNPYYLRSASGEIVNSLSRIDRDLSITPIPEHPLAAALAEYRAKASFLPNAYVSTVNNDRPIRQQDFDKLNEVLIALSVAVDNADYEAEISREKWEIEEAGKLVADIRVRAERLKGMPRDTDEAGVPVWERHWSYAESKEFLEVLRLEAFGSDGGYLDIDIGVLETLTQMPGVPDTEDAVNRLDDMLASVHENPDTFLNTIKSWKSVLEEAYLDQWPWGIDPDEVPSMDGEDTCIAQEFITARVRDIAVRANRTTSNFKEYLLDVARYQKAAVSSGLAPLDSYISFRGDFLIERFTPPAIPIGTPIGSGVPEEALVSSSEEFVDFEKAMASLGGIEVDSGLYQVEIDGKSWYASSSSDGGMSFGGDGWAEQTILITTRRPSLKAKLWRGHCPSQEAKSAIRKVMRHGKTDALDWRHIVQPYGHARFDASLKTGPDKQEVAGTLSFGEDIVISGFFSQSEMDRKGKTSRLLPSLVVVEKQEIKGEESYGGFSKFSMPIPSSVKRLYPNARDTSTIHSIIFEYHHFRTELLDQESKRKLQAVEHCLRRAALGEPLSLETIPE